jgi:hypothetical protein
MKPPYYWPTPFIESLLERALEPSRGEPDQPDLCVPEASEQALSFGELRDDPTKR